MSIVSFASPSPALRARDLSYPTTCTVLLYVRHDDPALVSPSDSQKEEVMSMERSGVRVTKAY